MHITFAPRGILQIDDARLVFLNFAGKADKYNREGDRNFAVVIPDAPYDEDVKMYNKGKLEQEQIRKIHEVMMAEGWNVKIKPPRDADDSPFMYLPVKVKYTERGGPNVYLVTGNKMNRLDDESISCLDDIDIASVDLDVRPYDWEVNGKTGRSAYLQSIKVIQNIDRFAARFAEEEYPGEASFDE